MMTSKEKTGFDPAAVLRVVADATASLEAELTPEERELMKLLDQGDESSSLVYSASEREQALSDFELLAVADALGALADQVQAMVDQRMAEAYRMALDAYYKIEELARDPAQADLLPHVAAMRRAHEEQYGRPIPPKAQE